jgi:type I restriction enzyme R subunit
VYSGDKPIGLFADQLPRNLERLNDCFTEISALFSAAGITDFAKLPDDLAARAVFAKHFNRFSAIFEAAKIQGFTWDKTVYEFDTDPKQSIALAITKLQYLTLLQRYKELGTGGGGAGESIPFDIDSHITEIDTGKIDADYMNSRFAKYLKELQSGDRASKEATLAELHRSFTSLSQEDQKLAEIFLHDIQRGDVQIDTARTFRDYLMNYKTAAKGKEVAAIVSALGVNAAKLIALMSTHLTEANLNEYGRFDDLRGTVDQEKAKAYFDGLEGVSLPIFRVKIKAAKLLSDFLLGGGLEDS